MNKPIVKEPKLIIAVSATIKSNTAFILDSGASQHISNDLRSFTSLEDIKPVLFYLADDRIFHAKWQGSVLINLYSRNSDRQTAIALVLTKVLYIPEAAVRMLSCI